MYILADEEQYWDQHPALFLALMAASMTVLGCFDYWAGEKPFHYRWKWVMATIISSCYVGACLSFLGLFRWPIAIIVFVSGMWLVWRLKPKDDSGP
jgi:hypothetical protein